MAYSVDVKNEVIERLKNQSAKEISEQMNISLSTIYKWKNYDPKGTDLAKVANVLHTTVDYLVCLTDDPTKFVDSSIHSKLTWRDLGQEYGGDSPVPDEFQTMVDSLAEGYFTRVFLLPLLNSTPS